VFGAALTTILRRGRLKFKSVDWIATRAFGISFGILLGLVIGGTGTSLRGKRDRPPLGACVIAELTLIKKTVGPKLNRVSAFEKGQRRGSRGGADKGTRPGSPFDRRKRKVKRGVGMSCRLGNGHRKLLMVECEALAGFV
jgi:hypothetical protein